MDKFDWLDRTDQEFSADFDLIISEPEVGMYDIPENSGYGRIFLILACDGLWDVASNELAVFYVRRSLLQVNSFQNCSEELVKLALRLGSLDNVSVIVSPLV
jgi:serine/threonine protein phosphatase PrpC